MCIEFETGQLSVLLNTLLCGLTDNANEFVSGKRYNKMFFFFSPFSLGRREFVQRLKLEAVLNVHDGCVSH